MFLLLILVVGKSESLKWVNIQGGEDQKNRRRSETF